MIKRLLQRDILDESNRRSICKYLLKTLIGIPSSTLANKLYLTKNEMERMKRMGMYFGSHGLTHRWLNVLNYKDQHNEIKNSFKYLKEINLISQTDPLVMCYPFGSYNSESLTILKNLNICYALTTNIGKAYLY